MWKENKKSIFWPITVAFLLKIVKIHICEKSFNLKFHFQRISTYVFFVHVFLHAEWFYILILIIFLQRVPSRNNYSVYFYLFYFLASNCVLRTRIRRSWRSRRNAKNYHFEYRCVSKIHAIIYDYRTLPATK